jgi:hypothetical protein
MKSNDLAENLRAEILGSLKPSPAEQEQSKQSREWFNARAHAQEIAQIKELEGLLEEQNDDLAAFGEPALKIECVDLLELDFKALCVRISCLGDLFDQRQVLLDELRAAATAEEQRRKLAAETPIERLAREVAEVREQLAQASDPALSTSARLVAGLIEE